MSNLQDKFRHRYEVMTITDDHMIADNEEEPGFLAGDNNDSIGGESKFGPVYFE